MLKYGGITLNTALYNFFTICWNQGSIPKNFKHAKVVAIYKGTGETADPASYRPIAITSVVIRLFEKLLKENLIESMGVNKLPSTHQFGFCQQRSTHDAIFRLMATITDTYATAQTHNKYVPVVFIDISKAYDKVWIDGLLYKLLKLHLPPNMYFFIRSFLTSRTIQVVHGGTTSSQRTLAAGVPQGSILAPFLFTIYLHKITKNIHKNTRMSLFADDIALQPTIAGTYRHLQQSLKAISKYAQKWKITFSKKKTKLVIFRPPALHNIRRRTQVHQLPSALKIANFNIEEADEYTYLGLTLDKNWSFIPHLKQITNKAAQTSYMIQRLIKRDRLLSSLGT